MRKRLFALGAVMFSSINFSLAQITFQKTFGSNEVGWFAQQTSDGGYIISGTTYNFGTGSPNVYLIKLTPNGDIIWTKSFGGTTTDISWSVQQTTSGYIISGWSSSFGAGLHDVYLINTDINGDTLWTKTFGGIGYDYGHCVKQTTDGGYIITGWTDSFGAGLHDVYLIKTDFAGSILWTKTFGGAGEDYGQSVQELVNGGYIITGQTNSFGLGGSDVYLIRTDFGGDTLWTKNFGGANVDAANSVQQTTDGGYIITGSTGSFGAGNYDVYLIKTDSIGNHLWSKTFGGTADDNGYSVQQTIDGGYIIAGNTNSFGAGGIDFYIIKTNSNGDALWTKTFGGTGHDEANSVEQTTDGGYIITGFTNSFGASGYIIYLIKTDANGNSGCNEGSPTTIVNSPTTQVISPATIVTSPATIITTPATAVGSGGIDTTLCTSVGIQEITTNNSIIISPNPSSGNFIISFEGTVLKGNIEILNILGENVHAENIFNESKKEINLRNISAGIYFVKVFNGEKYFCRKIIIEQD